ncbi:succinate dehydrogenase/fumarate reductase iron-sulfur subunit [Methylobacterium sp. J-068]|uniref:succinate dehydrogenase/fumarate reductase iron-sulfur subunit n=1 Tax=Methylobacterium sp. J-068 TaxID=2836649 RepID=UPI001FB95818|nr:succinate dehydrogenase/fumarate reductase iron-sulfur subunit [Methylobacterium sp. J-068]MCJ2036320.1 succinate dehydrogenase/fumarate reductase iron-sulfur subunit [Methylobacterium sp. J-068]
MNAPVPNAAPRDPTVEPAAGAMLTVRIRRDDGFQTFTLARRPAQTILDVVTAIQREQDPTLAYRFACRVGMCGSCAMMVNGRPRWTCRTRVAAVAEGDALTLEPLRNLPVVKDLAVDMEPFFTKWTAAHGAFEPGETPLGDFAVVAPDSPERRAVDAGIECINCGVCYAACDVVSWNPDYLGPAALNRAWTLINDVRDQGREARLDAVSGDAGCQSCHTHMSCTEHCPKALAPTFAIAGLKRETARTALRRFGARHFRRSA